MELLADFRRVCRTNADILILMIGLNCIGQMSNYDLLRTNVRDLNHPLLSRYQHLRKFLPQQAQVHGLPSQALLGQPQERAIPSQVPLKHLPPFILFRWLCSLNTLSFFVPLNYSFLIHSEPLAVSCTRPSAACCPTSWPADRTP